MPCHSSLGASPGSHSIRLSKSTAMRGFRLPVVMSLLLVTCLLSSGPELAAVTLTNLPAVKDLPTVGPPTTTVYVSGTGFDPYVAVDIYFDLTDLALTTTNGAGAFGAGCGSGICGIAVQVPASAVPGTHWITAIERFGYKAAQTPFLVRTDWAQFHFSPNHKGVNPYENVLSPSTVGSIGLHWSYNATGSSPVIADGVVYFASSGSLYALNATTGALRWKTSVTGNSYTDPAVANGVVYVGSTDGNLYALNGQTGAILWSYTTGEPFTGDPTVANGVVYFGAGEERGYVYALTAGNGHLLWRFTTLGQYVPHTPAVANGMVYVGSEGSFTSDENSLYALNATTGQQVWRYSATANPFSSPAVANGIVYVGNVDGRVRALNAANGLLLWTFMSERTPVSIETCPAVADGTVYVASDDGYLYALNAYNGFLLWKYDAGQYKPIESSPAVANGLVYFGSAFTGALYAVSTATGALSWYYPADICQYCSPAVTNGIVYVPSSDGYLYAFDLTGGQIAQKFKPPLRPEPNLLLPNFALNPSMPVASILIPSPKGVE